MNKKKGWLVTAAALVLIGCLIFGGTMMALHWDFTKLSTTHYETNAYELTENYKSITVKADTARVIFVPSNDTKTTVVCYEQETMKHTVTVNGDILEIVLADTRKWYQYIGFFFDEPTITVTLPAGAYGALSVTTDTGDVTIPQEVSFESIAVSATTGDVTSEASATGAVKLEATTGDITVKNVTADVLKLSVNTGHITVENVDCAEDMTVNVSTGKSKLTDVRCGALTSNGDTGDITMKNVVVDGTMTVERSTGDVKFEGCDAKELAVTTDTGDVKGTLLSDKVFIARTDTGRISVPKTVTGGRCEITTDTGNIIISVR